MKAVIFNPANEFLVVTKTAADAFRNLIPSQKIFMELTDILNILISALPEGTSRYQYSNGRSGRELHESIDVDVQDIPLRLTVVHTQDLSPDGLLRVCFLTECKPYPMF